jgi:hypothetical protein
LHVRLAPVSDKPLDVTMPVFTAYPLDDYPEVADVAFPPSLHVAFAVCSRECGAREFIVDGQTQVCQRCGRLMFRTEVREYHLAE